MSTVPPPSPGAQAGRTCPPSGADPRERAAAHALEQTRVAVAEAEKLDAIGQLTGGVAHDFNNLLSVLASGLDILSQQLPAGADRRVLDSMRRAIERGATMTQQLLAFARQQALQPAPHDLNELIIACAPVLEQTGRADLTLALALAPALPSVLVDAARFKAALLNLVGNAREAIAGAGRIEIGTAAVVLGAGEVAPLAPGAYVRMWVRDSGHGMAPEIRARACEPFYTTREVGLGTGLGLSQVQGFIAQSGGALVLDSEPGRGTTVALYLPATAGAPVPAVAEPAVERVLIVEDEPDLMEVAAELFRTIGYEVLTAASGAEALERLAHGPAVQVVFTDVVMPGMSGVALARAVRARFPDVRVVLASGHPLPALRADQAGIDDFPFISKPYRLSDILRRLR